MAGTGAPGIGYLCAVGWLVVALGAEPSSCAKLKPQTALCTFSSAVWKLKEGGVIFHWLEEEFYTSSEGQRGERSSYPLGHLHDVPGESFSVYRRPSRPQRPRSTWMLRSSERSANLSLSASIP